MTRQQNNYNYMRHALELAKARLGRAWPNPAVGAVIVKNGEVVGEAATAPGGRPHAEPQALAIAGDKARGATLYVTLEPCSHFGHTPPCADTIIAAGIGRVVVACGDSNPKVAGRGIAKLRAAGIEITEDVCEAQARALNEGFFSVIERGLPFVTLKLATSADGKITYGDGKAKRITGDAARDSVHALRSNQDAILTGIGTVLADDPQLTVRLAGQEDAYSPQRVLLDSQLRCPPDARILPAWIFTSQHAEAGKAKRLAQHGAEIIRAEVDGNRLSLASVLKTLAEKGVTRLMVEAGSAMAGSFIGAGLADRVFWYRAPGDIGESGMPALQGKDLLSFMRQGDYTCTGTDALGDDMLEIYDRTTLQLATSN